MKKLVKIAVLIIGLASIGMLMNASLDRREGSKDMEAAEGRTPSPSYQYHLQIFHAF